MSRIALTLFSIVGTTLTGVFLIALLAGSDVIDHRPFMVVWAAIAGFGLAVPASLIIAKRILKHAQSISS